MRGLMGPHDYFQFGFLSDVLGERRLKYVRGLIKVKSLNIIHLIDTLKQIKRSGGNP